RFEWHYTPKHGSWLNLAESELAVLSSQCLDRRIPNAQVLTREVDAWQKKRNTHNAKADWHFTTADARIKLKSLYPAIEKSRATSATIPTFRGSRIKFLSNFFCIFYNRLGLAGRSGINETLGFFLPSS